MRREEEYRRRLHQVSDTVRRRLNYQVEVEQVQRKFEQLHMIQWLEQTVKESVGKQVRDDGDGVVSSCNFCLGLLPNTYRINVILWEHSGLRQYSPEPLATLG